MKKLLALVLAILMLATVLAACGDDSSSSDSKTDTTPTQGTNTKDEPTSADASTAEPTKGTDTPASDPFYGEDDIELLVWVPTNAVALTKTMCSNFIAQYPDKSISIDVKPQEEGDAATQILNDPEVAADVFSFACDQLTRLNKAMVLSPLYDEEIEIISARDSAASVAAATLGGEVLAFPETGENGYYLVYDKSVISDEDAKTLEGVLAACRKAGRKFNMDAGNGFYACMFTFTGGLKIEGLEDGVQQFNDYDEDQVIDTLLAFNKLFSEYKDVFQSDNVDKTGAGMAQNPRIVAAGIDGSWNAATVSGVLGDDYGAVKLPTININGKDTQIISMNGYKLLGVNDYSDYPNAAHLLAEYLANEENQMARAKELSWSPSNKTVAASDVVAANLGTVACLAQAEFSLPQVNIADTFWAPMGTLGNYIANNANLSRATIESEFNKAIVNIKDE